MDRTRSSRKRLRRWTEIPTELLCLILRRLTVLDFIRCGAVCASWRSATLERGCSHAPEPPWVIVPIDIRGTNESVAGVDVVRLPERKLRKMGNIPDEVTRSFCFLGTSNGWLLLQKRQSVCILHALSGTVVQLPDLTTIAGVEAIPDADSEGVTASLAFAPPAAGGGVDDGDDVGMKRHVFKFKGSGPAFLCDVFIVPPSGARTSTTLAAATGRKLAVLAVCQSIDRLLFVRPRVDGAWSLVDMPAPVGNDIVGIAICRGPVCAVDSRGLVAAWDYCRDPGDATGVPQFRRVEVGQQKEENRTRTGTRARKV